MCSSLTSREQLNGPQVRPRKVGRVTEALDICRDAVTASIVSSPRTTVCTAWCAYDTELKPLVEDDQQASDESLLKAAQAVLKLCVQDTYVRGVGCPFVAAIHPGASIHASFRRASAGVRCVVFGTCGRRQSY